MAFKLISKKVNLFTDYVLETFIQQKPYFPSLLSVEFSATTILTTNSYGYFYFKVNTTFCTHIQIFINSLMS